MDIHEFDIVLAIQYSRVFIEKNKQIIIFSHIALGACGLLLHLKTDLREEKRGRWSLCIEAQTSVFGELHHFLE